MPHLCENSSGIAFEVLGLGCLSVCLSNSNLHCRNCKPVSVMKSSGLLQRGVQKLSQVANQELCSLLMLSWGFMRLRSRCFELKSILPVLTHFLIGASGSTLGTCETRALQKDLSQGVHFVCLLVHRLSKIWIWPQHSVSCDGIRFGAAQEIVI